MAGGMMEEQGKQGRWPNSKKGNDLKLPVDVRRYARIKELADCAVDGGLTLHQPRGDLTGLVNRFLILKVLWQYILKKRDG